MRDKITQKTFNPLVLEKTIEEDKQGLAYSQTTEKVFEKKAFIETYGCQMNFSDTEIVASVLTDMQYGFTSNEHEADVIFINTCSIRENAESKVWARLKSLKKTKQKTYPPSLPFFIKIFTNLQILQFCVRVILE